MPGRKALEGVEQDFEAQASYFDSIGIAVHAHTLRTSLRLFAANEGVRERVSAAWSDRVFEAVYERPLLFLAALRKDALSDPAHPLARAMGKSGPPFEPPAPEAIAKALAPSMPAFVALKERFVQTNEVSRSIVWQLVADTVWPGAPIALVDLGCSAGLNLVADRVPNLQWVDETGAGITCTVRSNIAARYGLDRAPIDARDPDERAWLTACVWPGQEDRLARLDAALDLAAAAMSRGELELCKVDATQMAPWLMTCSAKHGSVPVLAYQTVFSAYLPPAVRDAYQDGMRTWLAAHPGRAAWVELEMPLRSSATLAEIRAHAARSGEVRTFRVAGCAYHPSDLVLDRDAMRELAQFTTTPL